TFHEQAVRWTQASGLLALGHLPGDNSSYGYNVSADGSVIIGESRTSSSSQAFRWTQAAGMSGLGHLGGDLYSQAFSASADGSVIVGASISSASGDRAMRWTQAGG